MYICACTKAARQVLWAVPALAQWSITLLWLLRSQVCCVHGDVVPVDYSPIAGVLAALLLTGHVRRASILSLFC